MENKKQKNNWQCHDDNFEIVQKEILSKEIITIPCKVFSNSETGELKLYAKSIVEKKGYDAILKEIT